MAIYDWDTGGQSGGGILTIGPIDLEIGYGGTLPRVEWRGESSRVTYDYRTEDWDGGENPVSYQLDDVPLLRGIPIFGSRLDKLPVSVRVTYDSQANRTVDIGIAPSLDSIVPEPADKYVSASAFGGIYCDQQGIGVNASISGYLIGEGAPIRITGGL